MNRSPGPLVRAALTGSVASVVSGVALALCGRAEGEAPLAPVNAPSHWVWGDEALRHDGASARYTATGYLIHHLSSVWWAAAYERWAPSRRSPTASSAVALRDAAAVAALAAWVDLRVAPRRFTPGFERRLSAPSLWLVYGSFAAGLLLAAKLMGPRPR
ncbi:hypothetical protein [Caldimonas brevitalea]|uniref:Uncharacterized protein n=1 Tax=Caldimonas brevitalea TaxID=413882 RepID=A0A0G3BEX7_9BURK|nr:hypothetical protein [Caldimonas brevitalea]AKJ27847.1 hypothetical protein AAW51_1156 [Caldimonas brevitalea]